MWTVDQKRVAEIGAYVAFCQVLDDGVHWASGVV